MNSLISAHQKPKGFTLVEVLVVSVIIAILTAVVIPSYFGFLANQKRETVKVLAQTASVNASIMSRKGIAITEPGLKASLHLPEPAAYGLTIIGLSITITDASNPSISATSSY